MQVYKYFSKSHPSKYGSQWLLYDSESRYSMRPKPTRSTRGTKEWTLYDRLTPSEVYINLIPSYNRDRLFDTDKEGFLHADSK